MVNAWAGQSWDHALPKSLFSRHPPGPEIQLLEAGNTVAGKNSVPAHPKCSVNRLENPFSAR
jgi:hypothetical protein